MIEFENIKEAISLKDLEKFETENKVILPKSYKEHLLKFNGGYPAEDVFFGDFNVPIDSFLSLKHGPQTIEKVLKSLNHVLNDGEIPFAKSTSGTIFMSLNKNNYGCIYVAYSDWDPELLAKSFEEFIDGFHVDEI